MTERAALRAALRAAYPWVADPDVGPSAVEAGECERCARRPRCIPTCGPVPWTALCPDCAHEVGDDAWCDGHRDDGLRHRAWGRALPSEWATVARLWWVATGEAAPDDAWIRLVRDEVDERVRGALAGGTA